MTDTSYSLFDYSGAATQTTLPGRILDTDISIIVDDASSLPAAGGGKYASITIDRGEANEEHIFYTNKVGNELQGCLRGQDDTTARTHEAGAIVEHGSTAKDAREANAVVVAIGGEDGASDAKDLVAAFSTANAASANALTAAFTTTDATHAKSLYTATVTSGTWTPVYSSISDTSTVSSDGTPEARYFQLGKLVWFNINVHLRVLGGTGTGGVGITLPVAATLGGGNSLGQFSNEYQGYAGNRAGLYDANKLVIYRAQNVSGGVWDTSGTYSYLRVSGIYEAA